MTSDKGVPIVRGEAIPAVPVPTSDPASAPEPIDFGNIMETDETDGFHIGAQMPDSICAMRKDDLAFSQQSAILGTQELSQEETAQKIVKLPQIAKGDLYNSFCEIAKFYDGTNKMYEIIAAGLADIHNKLRQEDTRQREERQQDG